MRFIDSIQFRENPPSEFKIDGALWAQNTRLYHKDYTSTSHVLAYLEDIDARSFVYASPLAVLTHVINHNLGSKNLVISVQEDVSGSPGEYVQAIVTPTPGDEANSIAVFLDEPLKIHVTLIRP